jgi:hypothetical protein
MPPVPVPRAVIVAPDAAPGIDIPTVIGNVVFVHAVTVSVVPLIDPVNEA